MAASRKWSELSSRSRKLIVGTGVVEATLLLATLIDLRRRPADQVNGSKRMWTALAFVDIIGPIAYFSLGRRRGASDMSATTTIGRPPDEVFAYLSDVGNDVNWRTGIVDSGLRSDGPAGVGSVGYARTGKTEAVYRMTALEPPSRVDWEFVEGPLSGRGGYRLEPAENGTRFTLAADVRPSGPMKLLGPVFTWMVRRWNRSDVEALRTILESGTGSSGSQSSTEPAD
jgi:hypothetical protein